VLNTNSRGRFDLLVVRDGIVAVKGTYLSVASRAAGVGLVGAGGSGVGAAVGAGGGGTIGALLGKASDKKRAARLLDTPWKEVLELDSRNFFVSRDSIRLVELRKGRLGCYLEIDRSDVGRRQRFTWKPVFNDFAEVERVVYEAFGNRVRIL